MRERRQLQRYGRLAIGQRVRYSTAGGDRGEFVIDDMRESETGARVTLVNAAERITESFDAWGSGWGAFSSLTEVRAAPAQRALPGMAAPA